MLHHARSIGTYITCGTSFCGIWCPSCWGDFRRSMKRPCVREKSQRTETSMIDDQNLFLTKTDEKNKHAFNDLPILAAQINFPIHIPYEVIPNITCLLVQSPTRIRGLIYIDHHWIQQSCAILTRFLCGSIFQKSEFFTGRHAWNHRRSGSDAWHPWLAWSWCLRWRPHHPVTLGEVEM